MKRFFNYLIILLLLSAQNILSQETEDEMKIENTISSWHHAAAEADFESYFSLMTKDAIFIGTDPTEYWKGKEFKEFAKPYFDRSDAWSFETLDRNIFVDLKYKIAWFDELLDTQMGVCRGSGVLVFVEGQWKINHYVLSISIPNDNVKPIKEMNSNFNASFIEKLQERN